MSNTVFRWGVFNNWDWSILSDLEESFQEDDRVIIGLFSDDLAARYNNGPGILPFTLREKFLRNLKFVEDVIPITGENFSLEGVCRTLEEKGIAYPSTFLIGSEYGLLYQEDLSFAREHGVELRIPEPQNMDFDFLRHLLSSNVYRDYRIVLFGTGRWFESYMNALGQEFQPIYAVDNNPDNWGTSKMGIEIRNPEELRSEEKKHLLVLICVKNSDGIVSELRELGDIEYRKLTSRDVGDLPRIEEFRVLLRDEKRYLREMDELLLELLLEFDRVCTKYNLPYFLNCGSAIGAARHHGFIPWDDDLDVCMYQKDFDVLKSHADEIWPKGSDYRLVCPGDLGNGAFLDFLNRLMLVREHVDTNIFDKVKGKADDSIIGTANLDIYVMNNATPDAKKQHRNVMLLRAIYGLGMGHRAFVNYDTYKKFDSFTQFVVRVTSTVGKILPLSFIIWLHEHYARKFDKMETPLCFESNGYAMGFSFDKEIFGEGVRTEVCGHQIMVAADINRHLVEHGYVGYENYPPYDCRKPSHAIKSPELV